MHLTLRNQTFHKLRNIEQSKPRIALAGRKNPVKTVEQQGAHSKTKTTAVHLYVVPQEQQIQPQSPNKQPSTKLN
jgi:hypothetical protein